MIDFKEKVFQIVNQIPKGKVTTYGTIATLAGLPRGARTVGWILHNFGEKENLPWHRVINRQGIISLKCLEHQKEVQKALLEEEGIEVSSDFVVNLKKYGCPRIRTSSVRGKWG